MSETTDRQGDQDAWATACEEDLAAEQARRRERCGPPPADPAEELRRLVDAAAGRLVRFVAGTGAEAAPLAAQARSALDPLLERNAGVLRHLTRAGEELAAAYRAATAPREGSPVSGESGARDTPESGTEGDVRGDSGDSPPRGGPHRTDLD